MAKKSTRKKTTVENQPSTITIDGTKYEIDKLGEKAKELIRLIKFSDGQIEQLRNELAVCDTARIGYSNALKASINT